MGPGTQMRRSTSQRGSLWNQELPTRFPGPYQESWGSGFSCGCQGLGLHLGLSQGSHFLTGIVNSFHCGWIVAEIFVRGKSFVAEMLEFGWSFVQMGLVWWDRDLRRSQTFSKNNSISFLANSVMSACLHHFVGTSGEIHFALANILEAQPSVRFMI